MSEHGLEGEVYRRFIIIVKFVSQVFFQILFDNKVKHAMVNGPQHLLTRLHLVRQQSSSPKHCDSIYSNWGMVCTLQSSFAVPFG